MAAAVAAAVAAAAASSSAVEAAFRTTRLGADLVGVRPSHVLPGELALQVQLGAETRTRAVYLPEAGHLPSRDLPLLNRSMGSYLLVRAPRQIAPAGRRWSACVRRAARSLPTSYSSAGWPWQPSYYNTLASTPPWVQGALLARICKPVAAWDVAWGAQLLEVAPRGHACSRGSPRPPCRPRTAA